jgi:hypothetical protein
MDCSRPGCNHSHLQHQQEHKQEKTLCGWQQQPALKMVLAKRSADIAGDAALSSVLVRRPPTRL